MPERTAISICAPPAFSLVLLQIEHAGPTADVELRHRRLAPPLRRPLPPRRLGRAARRDQPATGVAMEQQPQPPPTLEFIASDHLSVGLVLLCLDYVHRRRIHARGQSSVGKGGGGAFPPSWSPDAARNVAGRSSSKADGRAGGMGDRRVSGGYRCLVGHSRGGLCAGLVVVRVFITGGVWPSSIWPPAAVEAAGCV